MKRVESTRGFIGLSPPAPIPASLRIMKHLSSLRGKKLLPMQTDRPFKFPECTVQIIRESLELTQNKNASRLPSITLPLHCFHLTEVVVGEDPDDRGNHVPMKWGSGKGPTGLTLTLLLCGTPQGLGSSYNL